MGNFMGERSKSSILNKQRCVVQWEYGQKIVQGYNIISMNNYNYLFKFIVIGDTGVGKSCVVLQFIENKTRTTHDVTIGVEFGAKTVPIRDKSIKLQIWDTAGQQNFRSITRSYYRSAIGALLVYDITRRDTFAHVKTWLDEVKANGNPHMEILLVGNKNDLESERVVTYEEGQKLAGDNGLNFVQINAKDYLKVQMAFKKVAECILEKVENGSIPLNQGIGVKTGQNDKSKVTKVKDAKNSKKKQCC